MMGMLNSLRQFFVPALSPVMFNIAIIVGAIAFVPVMPSLGLPPIAGIAFGALLGGFGQIAIQWPLLRREGFRYRFAVDLRDEGLKEILLLMGPGTLGLAAVQINIFVNTVLATGEGTGAVSWLSYAFRLMYLPIGLFGVSIATAALPELARYAAMKDTAGLRRTLSSGMRLMLMLNVPATVGLIALATPIVALIFERGQFAVGQNTAPTAAALMFYAPGLLGYSAVKLASPTFYALRDSRTPVIVSVLSVLVNLVLNVTLVRVIGYRGLALGTALAAIFNAAVLLWLLSRRLGGLENRRIAVAFGKIAVASAVMGIVAAMTASWLQDLLPGTGLVEKAVRVFGAIGAGVLVLAGCARLLRIEEFDEAIRRVTERFAPDTGRVT
jgi:putative peptidoglycan lipid II flippase